MLDLENIDVFRHVKHWDVGELHSILPASTTEAGIIFPTRVACDTILTKEKQKQ